VLLPPAERKKEALDRSQGKRCQVGEGLCPCHRQGCLGSSNTPGVTPRGCRGEKGSKSSYCPISSRSSTPWLWYGRSWCHRLQGARQQGISWGWGQQHPQTPTAAEHPRIMWRNKQSQVAESWPGQAEEGQTACAPQAESRGQCEGAGSRSSPQPPAVTFI